MEYERFKQFVQDVHGSVRGNLRTEIENAMREYREGYYGEDRLLRIEEDLSTLKAMVAEAEGDGGTTVSNGESTHPRPTEKPAANAARGVKLEYLVQQLKDETGVSDESGELPKQLITNLVESEYAFGEETIAEYVTLILSEFDAKKHPQNDALYVWGQRLDDVRQAMQENADDELDECSR
jgi:hypothetical protein